MGHIHGVFNSRAKAKAYLRRLDTWSSAEIEEVNLNSTFIPKTRHPESYPKYQLGLEHRELGALTHLPHFYITDLLDKISTNNSATYSWEILERTI